MFEYRTGKSNKAADALSCCSFIQAETEENETKSYAVVCQKLENIRILENIEQGVTI